MNEILLAFGLAILIITCFIILVDGTKIYFKKNIFPYLNLKKKNDYYYPRKNSHSNIDEDDDDDEEEDYERRYKNEEYKTTLTSTL